METIFIFKEVSVRVDKMSMVTYEQLFDSAMMTREFIRNKDAKSIIAKKLKDHGFKPAKTKTKSIRANNKKQNRNNDEGGNTNKRKKNS